MATNSKLQGAPFEHTYATIMAGGSGTRFWPLSRRKHPKQLLRLFGKTTLLEQTVARLRGLIPPERTYVFTSELVRKEVARFLPAVPRHQIVAEPAARNTAPCLGLAAHEIVRRDPEGLMVALPSDHVIRKPAAFRRALEAACRFASTEGRSVLIGLKPAEPNTGYGYLRIGQLRARLAGQQIFQVEQFTEKPNPKVAQSYLASGNYLWNGGMFIWRASTLLRNFELLQPQMARDLARIAEAGGIHAGSAFRRLYPRLEKISIDYALMEKISGVYAVAADIGWSDVGSWSVAYDLSSKDQHGNVKPRHSLAVESRGSMIVSSGKFVMAVGVRDLVIVDAGDALLVCARERSQDVGKAVEQLQRHGFEDLL